MIWREKRGKTCMFEIVATLLVFFPLGNVWASEITSDKVIELVNSARLSENFGVLKKDETLMRAARMKVDDMFEKGYFAHTSPEGKTPWIWFDKSGYAYEYAGENLAIHFMQAEEQQRAWMESPTHRKNILNPEYLEIGVAVRHGVFEGKETTITVQEFGRREKSLAAVSSTAFLSDTTEEAQAVPSESFSSHNSIALSNDATNRSYERMLAIFLIVIIIQVIALGYGLRCSLVCVRGGKQSIFVSASKEDERAYRVPVTVFSKKMAH